MQLTTLKSTAVLCFIAAQQCQAVEFTGTDYDVKQGKNFTLKWSDNKGPVDLHLKKGDASNLQEVRVIGTKLYGNDFTWMPDANLTTDTYAFAIMDGSDTNYSPEFHYSGASQPSVSAATPRAPSATSQQTPAAPSASLETTSAALGPASPIFSIWAFTSIVAVTLAAGLGF